MNDAAIAAVVVENRERIIKPSNLPSSPTTTITVRPVTVIVVVIASDLPR
jgi:hypothetical protein